MHADFTRPSPVAPCDLTIDAVNALAGDYGLATNYHGVGDPSQPNYVAMLGGSTFGISNDEPYWFPGHTITEPNLMSQLDAAGMSWATSPTPASTSDP